MYGSENWVLNRSEGRKIETADVPFLRRVSGYMLRKHVHNTPLHNAFLVCALEQRIQNYKTSGIITS
jgi:hypothetical protein